MAKIVQSENLRFSDFFSALSNAVWTPLIAPAVACCSGLKRGLLHFLCFQNKVRDFSRIGKG